LNLNIPFEELVQVVNGVALSNANNSSIIDLVFDSRRIVDTSGVIFIALRGEFRNGHDFMTDAHSKGIRIFLVESPPNLKILQDSAVVKVNNTLLALQEFALHHRKKFDYPIIAITGSAGKTTVKEWLYHLLSPSLRVSRSPKSYNSQLGVPLSLLELNEHTDVALIEVGISKPGEMKILERIVQPTYGIFTSFGRAHEENFDSSRQHLQEKLALFPNSKHTFVPDTIRLNQEMLAKIKGEIVYEKRFENYLSHCPFQDNVSRHNALMAIAAASFILKNNPISIDQIKTLPRLALRMELFEGIHGNIIINDTYNLDLDALKNSLEYQLSVAANKKRVVVIGLDSDNIFRKNNVEEIVKSFFPDQYFIVDQNDSVPASFKDSVVLIKGTRNANMQRFAKKFRLKSHKTLVEIDLSAVKTNLTVFKQSLDDGVGILAMVKAQSYGSGVEKMAEFLGNQGVDYLGVAYADEGVELRKQGINLPILVMNAEEEGYEDCINFNLEPAIFSFGQLDGFIKELINSGKTSFPVHVKIDTGMKRLGFDLSQLQRLSEVLKSQPEIRIKSIYSHLADADNLRDNRFTLLQIKRFEEATVFLRNHLGYSFIRHILNSEGIANYPEAQYDMVRLGVGMYGISNNPNLKRKLKPVFSWVSTISQIKTVHKGESVGYNRTHIASENQKIAVIPVGYADGFRRCLSNGKGGVIIHGEFCPTVGRVCMDMIMVDVTKLNANEGDRVEIIGAFQTIEKFAGLLDTIPYEVMTGISKRVHRIYLEE